MWKAFLFTSLDLTHDIQNMSSISRETLFLGEIELEDDLFRS
jgi:hypothetical protein